MSSRGRFAIIAAFLAVLGLPLPAWTPGDSDASATQGFVVNTTNRTDVLSFYNAVYTASQGYATDIDWTTMGFSNPSVSNGIPGTTSLTFKNDVQRRVDFYRALAGLTANITFSDADSSDDQYNALMDSANNLITHTPANTLTFYTSQAATAAANSNLAIGYYGAGAIDGYLMDNGSNNLEVGHRRWILYTQANIMGTGDIPPNGAYEPTNSLWVIDSGDFNTSAPPQFVSWPNSGYTPFPLMPSRWSLSYPDADFTAATVTMTQGGTTIPCSIIYADSDSSNDGSFIGDNTIVWEPTGLPVSLSGDTTYTVTVSGIGNITGTTSYSYNVTLFDPTVLGQSVSITGSSTPQTSGASYSFNSIEEADAYDLQVSTGSTAAWNEGAEPSPTPQIIADTTDTSGDYPLIQSAVVHSGSYAFQLAFPPDVDGNNDLLATDFDDQSFEITRQIIPTASSELQFYDLCRFALPSTTLSAQVSTDNGNTWTSVLTIDGVTQSGDNSNYWDQQFISQEVSLAAYAGQVILIRFDLSGNGQSVELGTPISYYGFFIDDITVTNATQLTNITDTTLANTATSFVLNSTTAGAALQAGSSYYLRIRPEVGLTWYGFGPYQLVTATSSTITGYSSWVSTEYPTVTGGATGDFSHDGIANGLKYAFGLDPTVKNPPSAIPQPVVSATSLSLSYTAPAGIAGVTYGAQWSTDLVNWTSITDTGTGNSHIFTVTSPGPRAFIRQNITVAP